MHSASSRTSKAFRSYTQLHYCRQYKDLQCWTDYCFHAAVTKYDEAFAWQILATYGQRWEEEAQSAVQAGEWSARGGAKQGITKTASKTIELYGIKKQRVESARAGEHSQLWSTKLREIAENQRMEQEMKKAQAKRARADSENENDSTESQNKRMRE